MTGKTYELRCRVCGRDFEIQSMILSGLASTADGRLLGTCNMSADLPAHSRGEVMDAYSARRLAGLEPAALSLGP